MRRAKRSCFIVLLFVTLAGRSLPACGQSDSGLTSKLQQVDVSVLVRTLMSEGDAHRGAVVFHQLQCTQCHVTAKGANGLGPNLSTPREQTTREYLIESILAPSKQIRRGYETVVVETQDGRALSGILTKQTEQTLEFYELSSGGRRKQLRKQELDHWEVVPRSLMPDGLINQLQNDMQFYDLAKYVIEVSEKGPERAAALEPPAALTALPPLPDYESEIDHRGLISSWDDESFKRGRKIYDRVCANCHGSHSREGSLPTAPRFATSQLKNGSDPFRMYQTLTHGYGLMVAQRWMVPREKYDVIHYIQRAYFRDHDRPDWLKPEEDYLAKLPTGNTFGPEPTRIEPYITMDYGPTMMQTFEIEMNNDGESIGENLGRGAGGRNPWANPDRYFKRGEAPNFAYKGIAVRLDPGPGGVTRGSHWMVYDHDTMNVHAAWSGRGFVDFCCIQYDGRHGVHLRLVGELGFENSVGPGWAQPLTGVFDDPRALGRDGRPYGPLPNAWLKYKGLFHDGIRTMLSYSVGSAPILELPSVIERPTAPIFVRQLRIGPADHDLLLRVGDEELDTSISVIGAADDTDGSRNNQTAGLLNQDGMTVLRIKRRKEPIELQLFISSEPFDSDTATHDVFDLLKMTKGSAPRWPTRITTQIETVHDKEFAVDQLTLPKSNPWNCQVRPTGHDFFDDPNRAAVCTWDGDVWLVEGIESEKGQLVWQRIASGLFQPLGLKIVDGQIFVTCRDQLVQLQDLNGDGETDFYRCFNNDHQVTEHFHEFAMGLQTDEAGNFYYAKSARHAKRAVVPHHGTLLRVAADGSRTDIIATGFRAANGVCLNPDGSFYVTDQEGHWNPKNRINRVIEGNFYGNMYGFTDVTDSSNEAMSQPLCWITNGFDRSPAELLWIPKDHWGPLGGSLLNLSYGYGKIYVVTEQSLASGAYQGGMCALPIPNFPSGLVRGRFHPKHGDLYVCSMFSWAGSQQQPGGFHRVRYRGKPVHLPIALQAAKSTLRVRFSHPLDVASASDPSRYELRAWDLKRTSNYGSDHFNERRLKITHVNVDAGGQVVDLQVPDLSPSWGMSLEYRLEGANGRNFEGEIHNSIFELPETLSN